MEFTNVIMQNTDENRKIKWFRNWTKEGNKWQHTERRSS